MKRIIVIAVLLLILIGVTVGGLTYVRAQQLHDTASLARQNCAQINMLKTNEHKLWDFIITISDPPKTPQAVERLEAFQKKLDQLFSTVPCR
jgi:hypothetical protein